LGTQAPCRDGNIGDLDDEILLVVTIDEMRFPTRENEFFGSGCIPKYPVPLEFIAVLLELFPVGQNVLHFC
jgi:hypothetical protein